jgi:DNA mismatch endonuclease (patch repair protein)
MQANRSFDTRLEEMLRSKLHILGLRFRKHANVDVALRCKADVVFRRARVCVFVDGCFWHGCRTHFRLPYVNAKWWEEKIEDNRRRDRRKTAALRRRGWIVVRIWEHQFETRGVSYFARLIRAAVRTNLRS